MLSALRFGDRGLLTVQPIRRRPLPTIEPFTTKERSREEIIASKALHGRLKLSGRDVLSAEESREETLMRPQWQPEYDPLFEVARSARPGGRGRLMGIGDAQRSWGRGFGAAMSGLRSVGVRGALDWVGRTVREEDDPRRDGGRRRLLRSDLSHRMSTRGRRAASVESRLETRRPGRMHGFGETRDEDSGALLVEFNDGTDDPGRDTHGVEGGSAGSAESGDTSQDGDEEVFMRPHVPVVLLSILRWRKGYTTGRPADLGVLSKVERRAGLRTTSDSVYTDL